MTTPSRALATLVALCFSGVVSAQAAPAAEKPYVVKQGTAVLDFTAIDARVARIPADKRAGYMNDPDRIESTLRGLLLVKQMAKEAIDAGIDKDPVVAAEIELARDEILAKRRVAKVIDDVQVPSMEALGKERYIASPALFTTPETLQLRHLLILRETHGEAAAKALAENLRAEIDATPGIDFEAFVKQHSEEPSAKEKGGLLPKVAKGDTLGDFESAAFALQKPGEISPVVRTRYGYHIIQLIERTPGARIPYEKVKAQVVRDLEAEFLSNKRKDYVARAQSESLDADPDKVQSLRTRYLPGGVGSKAINVMYGAREQIADEAEKAAAEARARDAADAARAGTPPAGE